PVPGPGPAAPLQVGLRVVVGRLALRRDPPHRHGPQAARASRPAPVLGGRPAQAAVPPAPAMPLLSGGRPTMVSERLTYTYTCLHDGQAHSSRAVPGGPRGRRAGVRARRLPV